MHKQIGEEAQAVSASLAALSLQPCQIGRWTDIPLDIEFVHKLELHDVYIASRSKTNAGAIFLLA